MGLDLCFNRKKAVDAGLILTKQVRGTPEEIEKERGFNLDPGYWMWLTEEIEVMHVPGTILVVENGGGQDEIIVRANQWGRVYEPLTTWLKANNIEWSEA